MRWDYPPLDIKPVFPIISWTSTQYYYYIIIIIIITVITIIIIIIIIIVIIIVIITVILCEVCHNHKHSRCFVIVFLNAVHKVKVGLSRLRKLLPN